MTPIRPINPLEKISFHGYGLIVGIAVAVVWQLLDKLSQRWSVPSRLAKGWIWVVVAALVGARAWHLWTDWSRYQPLVAQGQWWQVLAVWQGGLSVLGAISAILGIIRWLGGKKWLVGADVLMLALPWGQVIGRFANWWNQELYGLPTNLPWGIWINPAHRLASVAQFSYFHPLFAYEAIGVAVLGWWLWQRQFKPGWEPGSGRLTLAYLAGYSSWRFSLDFLRVDRPVMWGGLSQNQWCLVITGIVSLFLLGKKLFWPNVRQAWLGLGLAGAGLIIGVGIWWGQGHHSTEQLNQGLHQTPDGAEVQVVINHHKNGNEKSQPLHLQLSKTDQSRELGLSNRASLPGDGMLFWFDHSAQWLFWMKDMQFNLDFVWVRQGKVIGVTTQVPAPKSLEVKPPMFGPPASVDMVIEIAAGSADTLDIQPGDTVQLYPK